MKTRWIAFPRSLRMGLCASYSGVATPEATPIHSVILRVERGNPDTMPARSASHDKAQDEQTAAASRRPRYSPKSSSEVCSDAQIISAKNLNEDTVLSRAALDELEKQQRRVSFQVFDKKPPSLTRNTKPVSREEETPARPRPGGHSRRRHT